MMTDNYDNDNRDDRYYQGINEENEASDAPFQKKSFMVRDLEDEFGHDDGDRRTLDESEADEDDSDDE
jgi:hypothetical protein